MLADARKVRADEANEGIFWARFGYAIPTISEGFASLYGDGAAAARGKERPEALLVEAWRERPPDLRGRDRDSEAGPWHLRPGLSASMLYLDRFAGDFPGFARRLDWLSDLGIDIVHLMPFMKSPPGENDGGYAVSDYLGVDPRLGVDDDLLDTARLLHNRNMFLAADLVLNHSSDRHPWALAARAGDPRYRSYYWFFPDREIPDRFDAAMPEVFVEMLAIILGMANRGVDLIRLDAVPYLWKRPGTNCQNLPESHAIVRLLKAAASVVAPSLAFLAEAIVQPAEIVKYLDAEGKEECQLAYHASLMALMWESRISGTCASLCGLERALDSGDEIASLNDYSYEEVPEFAADNRWMHRPRMDWEVAAKAARGEGHEGRILSCVRRCLRLRRSLPALAQDAPFEVLDSEEGLWAVLRSPPDRASAPLLVLANFTEADRNYEPDQRSLDPAGEGFVALLAEGAAFGRSPIPIAALGVRWLARR